MAKCKSFKEFIKFYNIDIYFLIYRALHVSFGGLILRIESNPRYLTELTNGSFLYLLMNKI